MTVLNIGLACIIFSIDPNCEEWPILEVLYGVISMKTMQQTITKFKIQLPQPIVALKRCKKELDKLLNSKNDENNSLDGDQLSITISLSTRTKLDTFSLNIGNQLLNISSPICDSYPPRS